MKENKFIKKFENKSTEELEEIVVNKEIYVIEAREAALELLEHRKVSDVKFETLKEGLEKEKAAILSKKKGIQQQRVIRKGKQFLTEDSDAPQMHSKRVIVVFCGLFATIFGAVLLMYNLKQVKNENGRKLVLIFGIVYTSLIIVIANIYETPRFALFMNLGGGLILTEYFWNKYIGAEVKYRKRSWVKPAVISVLITLPFVLAAIYYS